MIRQVLVHLVVTDRVHRIGCNLLICQLQCIILFRFVVRNQIFQLLYFLALQHLHLSQLLLALILAYLLLQLLLHFSIRFNFMIAFELNLTLTLKFALLVYLPLALLSLLQALIVPLFRLRVLIVALSRGYHALGLLIGPFLVELHLFLLVLEPLNPILHRLHLHPLLYQLVVILEHFKPVGMHASLAQSTVGERHNRALNVKVRETAHRCVVLATRRCCRGSCLVLDTDDAGETGRILIEVRFQVPCCCDWHHASSFGGRDPVAPF